MFEISCVGAVLPIAFIVFSTFMDCDGTYARQVGRELTARVFEWGFVTRTIIFASGTLIAPSHRLTVTITLRAIQLMVRKTLIHIAFVGRRVCYCKLADCNGGIIL